MSFRRFLRELFSTITLIAVLLFLLLVARLAVFNPRLALALAVLVVAYLALMALGALLRKLRGSRSSPPSSKA